MIELKCEYVSLRSIWLCVIIKSRTHFRVTPHSVFAWMSGNFLVQTARIYKIFVTAMGVPTHNQLVLKKTQNHLAKPTKWLSWIVSRYMEGAFDCISLWCHVCISEWMHILYLPKCQKLLCRNRSDIWNLSDCHGRRTHNHLVLKKNT